jgi:hypothetical protein
MIALVSVARKSRRAFSLLLLAIVCTLGYACATYPRTGPAAIAGAWTNAFGTVWTVRSDGTFDVDLNGDNRRDAWGTYAVDGDAVTIHGTGGYAPADCKGDGVYRFTRGGDTLRFSRMHDSCKLRVRNVLLVWHRK